MAETKKLGRPTKYKAEFDTQAYKLCLLGATDAELADFFEVNEDTIHEWKKVYTSFSESIRSAKIIADGTIASKLYDRAKGCTVATQQAVKLTTKTPNEDGKIAQTEKVVIVDLIQELPPDTTAAIFWLKNRRKGNWRDKIEHGLTDGEGKDILRIGYGKDE